MKESLTIPPELAAASPEEIATALGITRQYVTVLRRKLAGNCTRCGQPASAGLLCNYHADMRRKRVRKIKNHKPWEPGKPGRPPKGSR